MVAKLPLVINSVDKPNIRFYSPLTQCHNFFTTNPIIQFLQVIFHNGFFNDNNPVQSTMCLTEDTDHILNKIFVCEAKPKYTM